MSTSAVRRALRVALVAAAVAIAVWRFLTLDAVSHSASDTLRPWVIEMIPVALVAAIAWIAIARLAGRVR